MKRDEQKRDGKVEQQEKIAKRIYCKPEIKSEKISIAALGRACNGSTHGIAGGRKASAPCGILLS